jgi:hypothetical protein
MPPSTCGLKQGRVHEEGMSSFGPHVLIRNTRDGTLISLFEFVHKEVLIYKIL